MAQEDSNVLMKQLDGRILLDNTNTNIVRLERMEDGNLCVPNLIYIRTCMRDILSQIWSVDFLERQREGHQRDNSPASESVEEYENEIPISHVNFINCYDMQ